MHHKLIKIAEGLICEVEKQTENLECVNTQELGEVIDMIQDLSKAIYYDVVTEAMLETEELGVEMVSSEENHGYASYKKYMEVKNNNSDSALSNSSSSISTLPDPPVHSILSIISSTSVVV